MNKIFAIALLFSLFVQGNSQVLTLDQAIKMGLDNSKQLKLSQAKSESASENLEELKGSMLPSVAASANYTRWNQVPSFTFPGFGTFSFFLANNYTTKLSASEPIFAGFRARNMLTGAQFNEKAARLDYEKDKLDAVLNIIGAYYNLYKVNVGRKLLNENIVQVKQHLDDIKNLGAQGLATTNDIFRVQLQLDNIQLNKMDMDNAYNVAMFNFNTLIGRNNDPFQVDSASMFRRIQVSQYDAYLQKAIADRPDLKAADLRNKQNQSNVEIAKGAYYPMLIVGGDYFYANPNPREIPPQQVWSDSWDIGISLNWDLMGLYTNKHKVNQAITQQKQSEATLGMAMDQARMELNQNFISYQESIQKISVAENSIKQAEENYRVMKNRYAEHVSTVTELLDANVLLLQAKMNLESARADAEVSYYQLLKATGNIGF